MPEIVLTEEQAKVLAAADTTVVVRDPKGATVGVLDPREAMIIARAKRRATTPGPRYSSASVLATLDALQAERDRIGPFSPEYAHEFVRRLEASDPEKYGPRERT
ncbi:MAG TPA: hypothetical protein VKE74_05805 [Gemmataceae bacterium]|nr:hypothetical protein [Gemmataceae bacterium]